MSNLDVRWVSGLVGPLRVAWVPQLM
jgi:hypothetical protein